MGQKISGGGRKVWSGRMRICICARHTPDTRGLRGRAGRKLTPPSGLLPRGPCASSGSWAQAWIPHRATLFLYLCSNREMGLIRTLLPFAEAAVRKWRPVAITNGIREALLLAPGAWQRLGGQRREDPSCLSGGDGAGQSPREGRGLRRWPGSTLWECPRGPRKASWRRPHLCHPGRGNALGEMKQDVRGALFRNVFL